MRNRGVIGFSVAGALVAAWLALSRSVPAPSPPQSIEERAPIALEAAGVSSSSPRELSIGREGAGASAADFRGAPSERAALPPEDAQPDVESRNPLSEQRARMAAAVSAAGALAPTFRSEARDRTWAETAEAELGSRIAQAAGLELTTLRIECRTTVCQMHFTFPGEAERRAGGTLALTAVNGTPGYTTGGLVLIGDDATLTHYVRLRDARDARAP